MHRKLYSIIMQYNDVIVELKKSMPLHCTLKQNLSNLFWVYAAGPRWNNLIETDYTNSHLDNNLSYNCVN